MNVYNRLCAQSKHVLTIACAVLLLSACSFQLRGDYQVTSQLQNLSLEAPARSEIRTQVLETFSQRGINVVAQASGTTHVVVHQDRLDRRILSMLASGQVAEYEMIYVLPVTITTQNGVTTSHNIQILRDYQDDPNYALAKTRELELLVSEMRTEAANRLLLLLNQLTID
ncbi:hypothetical protein CWE08_06365 [Aliidiomarina iranensis]|uniref:LPS-assembly lipoprotein LptE n=1 Tax=Aliidiomarina iranensis TaxID=1434071 RepID=A0A432VX31_9GAMM|nr:LPS assembly lipoprotein LptE [Aliidiomarina iranensis]RUO21206.1 hypothetical protein CWE08_06365 [Aliidiomarina iranensis]